MSVNHAATPVAEVQDVPSVEVEVLTPELVAKVIAGTAMVGEALRALQDQGWTASLTGQRITVDNTIEAVLHGSNGQSWWNIFAMDGSPPVWAVGTRLASEANWLGCVE